MFIILKDKTICLTRGDAASITITANQQDEQPYTFRVGDVVRFRVFKRKDCACVVIQKDVAVTEPVESVTVSLTKADTSIGDIISKPTDYWYEVELNPDSQPQTIIGYDEDGAKVFRLYPEGGDLV